MYFNTLYANPSNSGNIMNSPTKNPSKHQMAPSKQHLVSPLPMQQICDQFDNLQCFFQVLVALQKYHFPAFAPTQLY